ncbi:hypothetical protein C1I97_04145 [Streptomyces sp. NTH33]|uniref:hypothetical protein n=1 Tax=Streptomyces sp. NTH33 TaxID=1735453 RepID=UPI000DA9C428|nr:hypothetical protein [Streptomyces sp. NTH33]PZH18088.1 hypothetical protein C1I97_04145 [Streptomyces sp. NTH33]
MDEGHREGLERIRSKLELIRRVEAEHGFGVIIEGARNPEPVPELPQGVTEVFGLFSRLGADHFRFFQLDEIQGPATWAARATVPDCPLGSPLAIGCERHRAPEDLECGSGIWLDLDDGDVYYCDIDDYIHLYKHPDETSDVLCSRTTSSRSSTASSSGRPIPSWTSRAPAAGRAV